MKHLNRRAGLAAGVALGGLWLALGAAAAAASSASSSGERPPECVLLKIEYNSGNGPNAYVRACGMGSQGESWAADQARYGGGGGPLLVDGGPLDPADCTRPGTLPGPCVVLWPRSPVEGQGWTVEP